MTRLCVAARREPCGSSAPRDPCMGDDPAACDLASSMAPPAPGGVLTVAGTGAGARAGECTLLRTATDVPSSLKKRTRSSNALAQLGAEACNAHVRVPVLHSNGGSGLMDARGIANVRVVGVCKNRNGKPHRRGGGGGGESGRHTAARRTDGSIHMTAATATTTPVQPPRT